MAAPGNYIYSVTSAHPEIDEPELQGNSFAVSYLPGAGISSDGHHAKSCLAEYDPEEKLDQVPHVSSLLTSGILNPASVSGTASLIHHSNLCNQREAGLLSEAFDRAIVRSSSSSPADAGPSRGPHSRAGDGPLLPTRPTSVHADADGRQDSAAQVPSRRGSPTSSFSDSMDGPQSRPSTSSDGMSATVSPSIRARNKKRKRSRDSSDEDDDEDEAVIAKIPRKGAKGRKPAQRMPLTETELAKIARKRYNAEAARERRRNDGVAIDNIRSVLPERFVAKLIPAQYDLLYDYVVHSEAEKRRLRDLVLERDLTIQEQARQIEYLEEGIWRSASESDSTEGWETPRESQHLACWS